MAIEYAREKLYHLLAELARADYTKLHEPFGCECLKSSLGGIHRYLFQSPIGGRTFLDLTRVTASTVLNDLRCYQHASVFSITSLINGAFSVGKTKCKDNCPTWTPYLTDHHKVYSHTMVDIICQANYWTSAVSRAMLERRHAWEQRSSLLHTSLFDTITRGYEATIRTDASTSTPIDISGPLCGL